jgi:hypothetical protein
MSIITLIENQDPVHQIANAELERAYLIFCSYVCIMHNKKLNLPNIFLVMLKNKEYLDVFKSLSDLNNDYDCVRFFLKRDPTLHKSKYIKNYINEI